MIDETAFHMSAHGQLGCTDCHYGIEFPEKHPDPGDVDKRLVQFFEPDHCLMCHPEVQDDLDQGIHGSRAVGKIERYETCIQCHRPHSQKRLSENRIGEFDPQRPRREQCGACHEERSALPPVSAEDETCMPCHRLVDQEVLEGRERIGRVCLHCHAPDRARPGTEAWASVPQLDREGYDRATHGRTACTVCHLGSARYGHHEQSARSCLECHPPHDEKTIHDAHIPVTCEACHFKGIRPARDPETGAVVWAGPDDHKKEPLNIHEMTIQDKEASCRRCHVPENQVGAAAMVPPPKSIICMPCHTATLSAGDTTTLVALGLFSIGVFLAVAVWLSGSHPGREDRGPAGKLSGLLRGALNILFSRKISIVLRTLLWDVLLQRRLFLQSDSRWLIHSLIFLPIVFRFTWGLITLCLSLWVPEWALTRAMLDKNHSASAFLFDASGVMVLLGAGAAWLRGVRSGPEKPGNLPGQDRLAVGLLAGIVILGFTVEGMRIAMTGRPAGSWNAFIGYAISGLFPDSVNLTGTYGYLWYAHAILTGAFVAYLPFSRMFHILIAPVVLVMNAVSGGEGPGRSQPPDT